MTSASVQESHPHDIVITQEAPNYSSFSNETEWVEDRFESDRERAGGEQSRGSAKNFDRKCDLSGREHGTFGCH